MLTLRPTRRSRFLRLTALALGAALVALGPVGLGGCASEEKLDTSGPPPEGYEDWDEYWAAQDAMQRDLENTGQRLDMNRPSSPGDPR